MKDRLTLVDKVITGGLTTSFILMLSFIWWVLPNPLTPVPLWIVSLILIGCYGICLLIFVTSIKRKIETIYTLPKVKGIVTEEKIVFLVEENELYTYNSFVTICYQKPEDELEKVLGIGFVENINNKKLRQVVFYRISQDEEITKLMGEIKNKKVSLRDIKIKPTITKTVFEGGIESWKTC